MIFRKALSILSFMVFPPVVGLVTVPLIVRVNPVIFSATSFLKTKFLEYIKQPFINIFLAQVVFIEAVFMA